MQTKTAMRNRSKFEFESNHNFFKWTTNASLLVRAIKNRIKFKCKHKNN